MRQELHAANASRASQSPDAGRIVLDGETLFDAERRINLPPQRRRVGYLFQHYALFPTMTVRQNILCGLRWQKDRRAREAALQEAVRRFRLTGLEDHRPNQLSGGQAQRVALARMIVNRPRLLMLDEPFSALDSYLRTSLQVELSEMLSGVDQRVLLVTHDRDEAYRLCPRMAIMEQGRIVVQGTREAVFANPGTAAAAAITGCKNIAPARPVSARSLRCDAWDVTLTLDSDVPPDTRFVGLRAHAMSRRPRPRRKCAAPSRPGDQRNALLRLRALPRRAGGAFAGRSTAPPGSPTRMRACRAICKSTRAG